MELRELETSDVMKMWSMGLVVDGEQSVGLARHQWSMRLVMDGTCDIWS